jgi:lysophospholipase L1-like esterase
VSAALGVPPLFEHVLKGLGLLLLALACACSSALTPRADWRLVPGDVQVDANQENLLDSMIHGRDGSLSARGSAQLTLQLPPSSRPAMLTFTRHRRRTRSPRSTWIARSRRGRRWIEVARGGIFRGGLERVIVPARDDPTTLEVRFEGRSLDVVDIGLYELHGQRDDIWLAVGASIQEAGFTHAVFKKAVAAEFDYDPVVFNRAVSGWTAGKLRRRLPGILAEYPEARFVAIHIGGNDVSTQRPYPGGAQRLEKKLSDIVRLVQESGRVPIVARLSYRAYTKPPRVPPESNGSLPYVEAIYDPLIDAMTPDFSSFWGCGVVDPYTWYRDHPEELSRDGIHPNREGRRSWARLWAHEAGAVVY